MRVVFHPDCLKYVHPGHPERPERVEGIRNILRERGLSFEEPAPATKEDILLVHTEAHYERVMRGAYFDFDTPPLEPRFPLLSAGAALRAAETLGFALTRPPGHHAGRDFLGGFCYFNNIAIAVKKLSARTAILDLDLHHGNGTQDIFMGSPDTLFISLHQSPLYPGTGLTSEGNCLNFPLPPGTDEGKYLETLDEALDEVRGFAPEVLAISLGLDTYFRDPLGGIKLKEESYQKMGERAAGLGLSTFIVLEGGYSEVGPGCYNFLKAFA